MVLWLWYIDMLVQYVHIIFLINVSKYLFVAALAAVVAVAAAAAP